ncbi:hypothetical protein WN944_009293 [Citrus x changshan-huyou]|uniref:Uncharacterized protein n=1 Tax=Citrus x changshan-huyou TaxID=2935761 RepID=A0AAP0MRH9_9ROSI
MRIHDDIDPAIMSRCGGYTGMEANEALGSSYHAIRVYELTRSMATSRLTRKSLGQLGPIPRTN